METLLNLLQALKPGVDFTKEKHLVTNHILESLDIIVLATQLCDAFDVEITPLDVVPENFQSAEAIYALIQRLEDA